MGLGAHRRKGYSVVKDHAHRRGHFPEGTSPSGLLWAGHVPGQKRRKPGYLWGGPASAYELVVRWLEDGPPRVAVGLDTGSAIHADHSDGGGDRFGLDLVLGFPGHRSLFPLVGGDVPAG